MKTAPFGPFFFFASRPLLFVSFHLLFPLLGIYSYRLIHFDSGMHFFLQSILIFIELYSWCLIAWVILGYLPLFGVPFSLPILDRIVSPPLDFIRKTVPTSFS